MTSMWMIRGDGGRLYDNFKEEGVVAIGWSELADAKPGMTRAELASMYQKKRPEFKSSTIISGASQVWRFLNEMQQGDLVVTYDPSLREYLVGKIDGPAFVASDAAVDGMSILRKVAWHGAVNRDSLSVKAKNSLGSTLTVFMVPASVATELAGVVRGAKVDKETDIEDEGLGHDSKELLQDLEGRALEFTKDRVSKLDWDEMQELVAGILRAIGYKTRIARSGPDRGADIVASPDGLGFEMPRIVVEVKHRQGQIGSKEVRSFLGGRHKDDRGLYVSTGGYSKDSRYEADRAGIPLTLWDLDDLVRNLVENYEKLDSEIKQLVALKRVYWPV
jgi:restriction system protein